MNLNIKPELINTGLFHNAVNIDDVSSKGNNGIENKITHLPQEMQLNDVNTTIASESEMKMGKPLLKASQFSLPLEYLLENISELIDSGKLTTLDDFHTLRALTPENIQQAIGKVLTEEKSNIEQLIQDAQLPDEVDLKKMSQAIQVLITSSFFKDLSSTQVESSEAKKELQPIDSVKNDTFVGIISNNLLVELTKIIRKVMTEINISDRRISADFLQLNAKMVQASADSTIREGKEVFKGAMMGFFTSLAITAAGGAFQARGLRQQHQSIKNNLIAGNKNLSNASKLSDLNSKVGSESTKPSTLSLTGKDGSPVTLSNQATQNQKDLASHRINEASKRVKDLGMSQHQQHEKIMNKSRVQMGIADQVSRMSDNAGQLATTSNQVNVKSAEADKMIQQTTADIARSISSDKDKQLDKSQELAKQMRESLIGINESDLKTMQSIVRG